MQEIEKLIEIKERRKLSYETMAYQIGVSFQTVLRWINKGDKPGSLALAQIKRFIEEDEAECKHGNHHS
jgi:DNA-binding transcriptional regulator YiaG